MNDEITSFLSFKLKEETFVVEVAKVLEILEVPQITKVPNSPDYLIGVINLRGNVLPVVDTRIKFHMGFTEFTIDTCIVVFLVEVENETLTIGAIVDSVQEVIEISKSQLSETPSIGTNYRSEFIKCMAKVQDKFIMVVNIDSVISSEDVGVVKTPV